MSVVEQVLLAYLGGAATILFCWWKVWYETKHDKEYYDRMSSPIDWGNLKEQENDRKS